MGLEASLRIAALAEIDSTEFMPALAGSNTLAARLFSKVENAALASRYQEGHGESEEVQKLADSQLIN